MLKVRFQVWLSHSKVLVRRGSWATWLSCLRGIHPSPCLGPPTPWSVTAEETLSVSGPSTYQGPHTLPSHLKWGEPGAQPTAVLRSAQSTLIGGGAGAGSCRLWCNQIATSIRSWRWGCSGLSIALNPGPGQWVALERSLDLCKTQPLACPQAPCIVTQTKARAPAEAMDEGWNIPFTTLCWEAIVGPGLLTSMVFSWGWQLHAPLALLPYLPWWDYSKFDRKLAT